MAAEEAITQAKACKKCGETKPLQAFPKCPKARDGKSGSCIKCTSAYRRAHEKADPAYPEKNRRKTARWRDNQGISLTALRQAERRSAAERQGRTYRTGEQVEAHRESIYGSKEERSRRKREKRARRKSEAAGRTYYGKQRWEELVAQRRVERIKLKPWTDPSLSVGDAFTLRYKLDPEFNLRQRLRAADRRRKRGKKVAELFRGAIKSGGKSPTLERLLGYTVADLKRHLERQFTQGMTWQAFTTGAIHIDHILPLSGYDLLDPLEHRAAWAMSNLRPLWKTDNIIKSNKRTLLV